MCFRIISAAHADIISYLIFEMPPDKGQGADHRSAGLPKWTKSPCDVKNDSGLPLLRGFKEIYSIFDGVLMSVLREGWEFDLLPYVIFTCFFQDDEHGRRVSQKI